MSEEPQQWGKRYEALAAAKPGARWQLGDTTYVKTESGGWLGRRGTVVSTMILSGYRGGHFSINTTK